MKEARFVRDHWKIPPSPPLKKGGVSSLGKIPVIQACLRAPHRQSVEEWAEGFTDWTEQFLCSRWLDRAILAVLVFAVIFFGRVFIGHF